MTHLNLRTLWLCACLLFPLMMQSAPTQAATAKASLQAILNAKMQAPPRATPTEAQMAVKQASPWQLIFVFADWCPYCHQTAPIVKAWATRHRVRVRALSITGKGLPDYPQFENLTARDRAAWFHGHLRVPALLAQSTINPDDIKGIASGAVTDNQLSFLWSQTLGIPVQPNTHP